MLLLPCTLAALCLAQVYPEDDIPPYVESEFVNDVITNRIANAYDMNLGVQATPLVGVNMRMRSPKTNVKPPQEFEGYYEQPVGRRRRRRRLAAEPVQQYFDALRGNALRGASPPATAQRLRRQLEGNGPGNDTVVDVETTPLPSSLEDLQVLAQRVAENGRVATPLGDFVVPFTNLITRGLGVLVNMFRDQPIPLSPEDLNTLTGSITSIMTNPAATAGGGAASTSANGTAAAPTPNPLAVNRGIDFSKSFTEAAVIQDEIRSVPLHSLPTNVTIDDIRNVLVVLGTVDALASMNRTQIDQYFVPTEQKEFLDFKEAEVRRSAYEEGSAAKPYTGIERLRDNTVKELLASTSDTLPWLPLDGIVGTLPGFLVDKMGKAGEFIGTLASYWRNGAESVDHMAGGVLKPILNSMDNAGNDPANNDYTGKHGLIDNHNVPDEDVSMRRRIVTGAGIPGSNPNDNEQQIYQQRLSELSNKRFNEVEDVGVKELQGMWPWQRAYSRPEWYRNANDDGNQQETNDVQGPYYIKFTDPMVDPARNSFREMDSNQSLAGDLFTPAQEGLSNSQHLRGARIRSQPLATEPVQGEMVRVEEVPIDIVVESVEGYGAEGAPQVIQRHHTGYIERLHLPNWGDGALYGEEYGQWPTIDLYDEDGLIFDPWGVHEEMAGYVYPRMYERYNNAVLRNRAESPPKQILIEAPMPFDEEAASDADISDLDRRLLSVEVPVLDGQGTAESLIVGDDFDDEDELFGDDDSAVYDAAEKRLTQGLRRLLHDPAMAETLEPLLEGTKELQSIQDEISQELKGYDASKSFQQSSSMFSKLVSTFMGNHNTKKARPAEDAAPTPLDIYQSVQDMQSANTWANIVESVTRQKAQLDDYLEQMAKVYNRPSPALQAERASKADETERIINEVSQIIETRLKDAEELWMREAEEKLAAQLAAAQQASTEAAMKEEARADASVVASPVQDAVPQPWVVASNGTETSKEATPAAKYVSVKDFIDSMMSSFQQVAARADGSRRGLADEAVTDAAPVVDMDGEPDHAPVQPIGLTDIDTDEILVHEDADWATILKHARQEYLAELLEGDNTETLPVIASNGSVIRLPRAKVSLGGMMPRALNTVLQSFGEESILDGNGEWVVFQQADTPDTKELQSVDWADMKDEWSGIRSNLIQKIANSVEGVTRTMNGGGNPLTDIVKSLVEGLADTEPDTDSFESLDPTEVLSGSTFGSESKIAQNAASMLRQISHKVISSGPKFRAESTNLDIQRPKQEPAKAKSTSDTILDARYDDARYSEDRYGSDRYSSDRYGNDRYGGEDNRSRFGYFR